MPRRQQNQQRHKLVGLGVLSGVSTAISILLIRYINKLRSRDSQARQEAKSHVESTQLKTSVLHRRVEVSALAAKSTVGYAKSQVRKSLTRDPQQRQEIDDEFAIKTAEQVVATLGNMKGAMMKLGQMASYLHEGLPQPIRDALAQLQQDAPPMSRELTEATVKAELGSTPEQIFAEWDYAPLAAASIGQVHRARLHDGREVAVKVQYPGVDEAIEADLKNIPLFFNSIAMLAKGFDSKPVIEELQARLAEELDYEIEARNQSMFVDYYRGHPFITIPEVVKELSTRRVLTTEFARGARFAEVLSWSQAERNLAGETMYRFVFDSLYRLHAFNADPQPGNYVFRPGGRVTFLDFGLSKVFERSLLDLNQQMIEFMVTSPDPKRFRQAVEEAGFLVSDAQLSDQRVFEYFSHFYVPLEKGNDEVFLDGFSSETVSRYFDFSGPFADVLTHVNMPAEWALSQRINLGLYALLAQLKATAPWREIAEEIWPWINAQPATGLGVEHAEFRAKST